jgi:surface antigen
MLPKSFSILVAAIALVGVTASAIGPALAQQMQSYLPRRLTQSDLAILQSEAGKLGPNGPKEEGWHNPKTGNSGVVTFLNASTKNGMACREFRYTFHTGTPQDGTPYKLNWCQTSAGKWVIAS